MGMLSSLKELYSYRDLLYVFIWREFSLRYKQSVFGILWAVIQPLSMMLLFTAVFTYIMPTKVSNYPYATFFFAALLPWTFFSGSLNYAVPSLSTHYQLITKIYFPREILPFAGIAVGAVDYALSLIFYFFLLLLFDISISFTFLWILPLTALLILFTAAISLLLAALNVYYRDVRLAINFLIQTWFFATPIFYSIDAVPQSIKPLLFLNPLTFLVENIRRCTLENRDIVLWQFCVMTLLICIVAFWCYRFFKITERKFADVI